MELLYKLMDFQFLEGILQIKPFDIIIVLILLSILYFLFNRFLISPLNVIIERRENKIDSARKKYEDSQRRYDENLSEYRDRLNEAKMEAAGIREKARKSAARYRENVMEKARNEAGEQVDRAAGEIDAELDRSKELMKDNSEEIARLIVDSLLESGNGSPS